MRRLFSFALFACSVSLTACSGEGFDLPTPVEETGAEKTAPPVDGQTDTGAAPETNKPADTGNDAADASDVASETPDVATTDACVPNACGGCATLTNTPGTACGVCGDGKWACNGKDATRCEGARARNACGGCTTLITPPSTACGTCGGGTFVCNGTDATKCNDPVTTPAPGTTCGTCGTSKYACAPDGKSTICSKPDDRNACGGCGTLSNAPGTVCGACGVWTCSTDKSSLACNEASPSIGTTCGTCMKSQFVCSAPGVTSCAQSDDRRSIAWGPTDSSIGAVDVVSPRLAQGLELTVGKTGEVESLRVAIKRRPYECADTTTTPHPDPACTSCRYFLSLGAYACSVGSPVVGKVTATFWLGAPGSWGASTSASFSADNVVLSSPDTAWITFPLPKSLAVKAGDRIYVELTSDSTTYDFTWNRTPESTTKSEAIYYRVPSSDTTWSRVLHSSRPLEMVTKTCDY